MPTTQLDAALVKDGKVGLLAAMVGAKLCGSTREARQLFPSFLQPLELI